MASAAGQKRLRLHQRHVAKAVMRRPGPDRTNRIGRAMPRLGCFGQFLAVAGGLLALYAYGMVRPLLWAFPEQDACSFGPVSNARYRELLAIAKIDNENGRRTNDAERLDSFFQKRLDHIFKLTDGSYYEKIAALHAVIRADGGQYRSVNNDPKFPYPEYDPARRRHPSSVTFIYYIWRLDYRRPFYPIGRGDVRLLANLYFRDTREISVDPINKSGSVNFIKHHWHPFYPNTYEVKSVYSPNCPPVPGADWLRHQEELIRIESKQL